MTDYTTLPYRCPKCFYRNSFPDITTLRTHLELEHSYVQLSIPLSTVAMVTSPVSSPRSYSPRSTFPVVGRKKGFKEQARELEAQLLLAADTPRLGTSRPHNNSNVSHASVLDALLMGPPRDAASPGYFGDKDASSPGYYGNNEEEVGRLKQELMEKEHDLAKTTLHLQEMQFEQVKAKDENQDLSQTVESHSKEIAELKSLLRDQHREIQKDERKLLELNHFLEDIDTKQTTARESLKHHLDGLVDRAEQAEMEVLNQSAGMAESYHESPRPPSVDQYEQGNRNDYSSDDAQETHTARSTSKSKLVSQPSSETTPPHHPSPPPQSSTHHTSSTPLPDQQRQQQLDILQQQLETLQQQQNKLQQFLVQLSDQPAGFQQMEDISPIVVKKLLSQTLSETSHGGLPTGDQVMAKTSPEASRSRSNDRKQDSSSGSKMHRGSSSTLDSNQSYYGTSQDNKEKELQHQHTTMESDPMMHHNTLPWQQSSILPSRHNNRASLSSTLPSYAGSELPNFTIQDENHDVDYGFEDEIQNTEALFESAHVEEYYMPKPNDIPENSREAYDSAMFVNTPMQVDSANYQSALYGSSPQPHLPNNPDQSSSSSSSDTMNFKVLEAAFQDIINHKQSSQIRGNHHSNSSGLTSLPNRQQSYSNTDMDDVQARTLPNGIPKSTANHSGSTSVDENDKLATLQNIPEIQINSRPNSVASNKGLSVSCTTVSELSDVDDTFTDVTYTPTVSVYSGYTKLPAADSPLPSTPMTRSQEDALLTIFSHLDQQSLLNCALVCQYWKRLSRHPSLWRTVRLADERISSKFLQTISSWCTELEWLYLDNLKPRKKRPKETKVDYKKDTRGCLESGLEYLLHNSGSQLISLMIQHCHNILTERCLWLASCYCSNLYSVTYVSQTDPAGHEVIWALGAGCRTIESLKIPPGHPCDQPYKFNNRCTQMVGRCWPQLKALSIGGKTVDGKGLVTIAKNCLKLQVLELDHMSKVTEPVAIAMTKNGLRGLQVLIFRHTPVTTKAILQFNGGCSQLRSMSILLSPFDYFMEGEETIEENRARFEQLQKKLQALAERPGLRDVVHLFFTTQA